MKPLARLLLTATAMAAAASLVHAQPAPGAPPPAPPMIKPVKAGLYMVTGQGGNTTVRVTSEGLIVVDTKNAGQPIYDALIAQIRTVSPAPVKYVVDTHHHADHTGNNQRFLAAGAQVIGQENLKAELAKFTPPANNPAATAPAQPSATYRTEQTLKLGGATAELHHYGPGHTSGDTIVYFPDVKVVALGDEFVAATPNFDYAGGASLGGWIGSLDQVLKLDFDTAIPGHGNDPMTKADVQAFRGKLNTFLTRAKEQVKAGTPKDQLIAKIKVDDLGWTFNPNAWTQPGRVDALYAEASK